MDREGGIAGNCTRSAGEQAAAAAALLGGGERVPGARLGAIG